MKNKAVILIVDDVAVNIHALAHLLKNDYILKVATGGMRALELVHLEPIPDLILLDVKMPGMDGYEVLENLKNDYKTKDIPVIFVTGNSNIEDEEKGLSSGAVDYITKPIRPIIVKSRVKTAVSLKLKRDNLLYNGLYDKLTGLYNRHNLFDAGEREFAKYKRSNNDISIVRVKITNYKKINIIYGDKKYDDVILDISKIIKDITRAEDFIARNERDEFTILLVDCNIDFAIKKAELIKKTIEKYQLNDIKVRANFAVTSFNIKRHRKFNGVLVDIESAIHKAKTKKGNKIIVFRKQ